MNSYKQSLLLIDQHKILFFLLSMEQIPAVGDRNIQTIVCSFCDDIILRPQAAILTTKPTLLPQMKINKDTSSDTETNRLSINGSDHTCDTLESFWLVSDMFTFENVGFSNTVNNQTKYLVCANCERGPIGFSPINPSTRQLEKEFYVAIDRIKYK
jgi:guanine nucleotide exchange factor